MSDKVEHDEPELFAESVAVPWMDDPRLRDAYEAAVERLSDGDGQSWALPVLTPTWPAPRPIGDATKYGPDGRPIPYLAWCPDEPPGGRKRVIWWEANLLGPRRGGWMDDAELNCRPTLVWDLPPDPETVL